MRLICNNTKPKKNQFLFVSVKRQTSFISSGSVKVKRRLIALILQRFPVTPLAGTGGATSGGFSSQWLPGCAIVQSPCCSQWASLPTSCLHKSNGLKRNVLKTELVERQKMKNDAIPQCSHIRHASLYTCVAAKGVNHPPRRVYVDTHSSAHVVKHTLATHAFIVRLH